MITEYKTIDMEDFYDIPRETMYLVLSESKNETRDVKRIKVTARRYIDLEYDKNEPVRVLVKTKDTVTFDTFEIPCYEGVYDLRKYFIGRGIGLSPLSITKWKEYQKDLERRITTLIFSKYALVEGLGDYYTGYYIAMNSPIKIEGTKHYFYYATFDQPKGKRNGNLCNTITGELLNKCLHGEAITEWDFYRVLDAGPGEFVRLNFGSLDVIFDGMAIYVKKLNADNPEEKIWFMLRKERIVLSSMFLSQILHANSDRQLFEAIAHYYV